MNRDWHLAHPIPPRATEAERIAWHIEHAAECACRRIPDPLVQRMRDLGIDPPQQDYPRTGGTGSASPGPA